jgi:ankyrin repeat protein
MVLKRIEVSK